MFLLLWYTPPQKGAFRAGQFAQAIQRREMALIRDDEVTLLLLWWELNEFDFTKESNYG